ncbi:MAG: FkbM family methyltransferase [Pseudomonadota bacterium]
MLWRALGHIKGGRYVDVGANDPVSDSVSCAFYERGWQGVHIEPMTAYAETLREARPGDTVIEAAVSTTPEHVVFFDVADTGLSTSQQIHADEAASRFGSDRVTKLEVPTVTLAKVLKDAGDPIHWLKVDVEGSEADALESWGEAEQRPWIVVVESTLPNSNTESFKDWEPELTARDYRFVYFDGLNRFYVHKDHEDLADAFKVGPNFFDDFEVAEGAAYTVSLTLDLQQTRAELSDTKRTFHEVMRDALAAQANEASDNRVRMDAEIANLRQQIHDVHAQLQGAQAKVAELDAERHKNRAEITETHLRLQDRLKELQETHLRLQESERELHDTHLRLQGSEKELHDTHLRLQGSEKELHETHGRLQESERELHETHGRLQGSEKELHETHGRLHESKTELHETHLRLVEALDQQEALRQQNENFEAHFAHQSRQFTEALSRERAAADLYQARLLEEAAKERNSLNEEIEAARREGLDRSEAIERDFRNSLSWRLATPVRVAGILARTGAGTAKSAIRRGLSLGLDLVRRHEWLKKPVLRAASVSPALSRRLVRFGQLRAPEGIRVPPPEPGGPPCILHPDAESVRAWASVLELKAAATGSDL